MSAALTNVLGMTGQDAVAFGDYTQHDLNGGCMLGRAAATPVA